MLLTVYKVVRTICKNNNCQLICVYSYYFSFSPKTVLFLWASAFAKFIFGWQHGTLKGDMHFLGLFFNLCPIYLKIIILNLIEIL